MDYRAESDPTLHSPGSDRTSQNAPNLIPPAAPPRAEDPRVAHVRVQLELAIRQLNADIAQLTQERDGLDEEITAACLERDQLTRLMELDPALFERVIAVLKLEAPAGDAPAIPPAAPIAEWVTMPGLPQLLAAAVLEDSPGPGRLPDYERRNRYVLMAVGAAAAAGIPVGFLIDPGEVDWPCVMFELPTGQIGWHLPRHDVAYDGHTTPDKNVRIDAWLAQIEEGQRDG